MKGRRYDYIIALVVVGLTLFGVVMVFSASYYDAQVSGENAWSNVTKQAALAVGGIVLMAVASNFRYTVFSSFRLPLRIPMWRIYRTENAMVNAWRSWPTNAYVGHERMHDGRHVMTYSVPVWSSLLLVVSWGALLWLAVGGGNNYYGASRWISLFGISVQPSEFARLGVILFLADDLSANYKQIRFCGNNLFALVKLLLPSFFVTGVTAVLIMLGNSMSMTMTTLILFLAMLTVARVKPRHLVLMIILGVALALALIFGGDEFRQVRFTIYHNPWNDPQNTGYQLIQSLYALANGGLFGAGPGGSRQKFAYLTFGDSDFILSIIGEEYGFVGIVLLLAAFSVLVWRGYKTASLARDSFGAFLAVGMTSIVWIQLLINALVVSASMPPTGLPLPFISAGGSSLLVFLGQMGVLLNITRHTRTL